MAEDTTDVIRTKRIEVVDDDGRVRVVLGHLWDGEGPEHGIGVHGRSGSLLAWVTARDTEPEVGIAHGGNVIATLRVGSEGEGEVFLADADGIPIER